MLAQFIRDYGYWAVLIGTLFEGETILVMGGFAAHRGYLSLPAVVLLAFCGSLLGDQTMFWIGRGYGRQVLGRWPGFARRIDRARPLVDRFGSALAVLFRFFYGLRNATPIAMALSGFSARRFLVLNALGAAIWAIVVGGLGFAFGEGLELVLVRAHRYEAAVLASIACAGAAVGLLHHVRRRRSID